MGNSPPTILSDAESSGSDGKHFPMKGARAVSPSRYNHSDINSPRSSTDSILQAAADGVIGLSQADGIAIAVRDKQGVICRARSGDLAPALGSPLNVESGFSGECFRSAKVLVCSDTENDPHVDAEVCREFGIRSIAAIPLKGLGTVVGILEAFSSRPAAFGPEEIATLQEFAEVIEAACESEAAEQASVSQDDSAQPPATPQTIAAAQLFEVLKKEEPLRPNPLQKPKSFKRYWLPSVAVALIALLAWVFWLGWQDPSELEASEPAIDAIGTSNQFPAPAKPPKPEPGLTRSHTVTARAIDLLKNAAKIEAEPRAGTVTAVDASGRPLPESRGTRSSDRRGDPAADVPPPVEIAALEQSRVLPSIVGSTAPMPALGVRISQGVTEGALIHQVQPVYPAEARMQRINGSVVLDVTIRPDGSVQNVKTISGPPILAAAASQAVREWRYSPSLLNGTPIQVEKRVTVAFKLP